MNDRYTTDDHKGQTRKSAATMKPKSKAASSVRVQSTTKTKQQKKAEQKAARQKQSQIDRKYYNPPTEQYKKLRRLWWILLVGAIAMTAFSWLSRSWFPNTEMVSFVALGLAYVLIIAALYIDFSKIRKVRRAYQEEMEAKKTKEVRAMEKQAKAEQLQKKAAAKDDGADKPAVEAPKKRSLFGSGFRLSKAEADKTAKKAEKVEVASQKDETDASSK
ncbi:hypothetical protein [Raoultibacter phocaeensis]|uniref:hypothetical protein n=1 Tax=Raoultibacter phocaeensis TaxID=2479841 RepID=UPI002107EDFF|nr:hypothetical protein [Raoultibacter phocaeensis]